MRRQRTRVLAALLGLCAACGDGGDESANASVRARLDALAPAANLAHRGQGPTRPRGTWPENSLPAFRAAMQQGADGIELDVVLTRDGRLVVLHDDTFDRTTSCSGCANAQTFDEARACALLDGARQPTAEHPPTLAEAFAAAGPDGLVNVELKVYGAPCLTPTSGAAVLARTAVAEIRRLGVQRRTLFSSFDEAAVVEVKRVAPELYAALLFGGNTDALIERAAALGLDAIHPFWSGISAERIVAARRLGLQVNLWTVNGETFLTQALDKDPTGIVTDEPGVLRALLKR